MFNLPIQYIRATQTGLYHLARCFGFQQFNYSFKTKRWVPAAAGLAADQLVALLQDAATRRCASRLGFPQTLESWEAEWAAAIADLHREYFEEYHRWQYKLQLPDCDSEQGNGQKKTRDTPVLILELGLQFLIYTEAANLRHTPHLMFLIYYIMRGSQTFQQTLRLYRPDQGCAPPRACGSSLPFTHWRYWLSCGAGIFGGNKPSGYDITSLHLNLLQQMYEADPAAFHYKDPQAPTESFRQTQPLVDAVRGIVAVSVSTEDNPRLQEMTETMLKELQDIFSNGSQQVFLNHVVQPLFYFLAEQIDLAGHQGSEEAALRIAYCDVDETCCSPAAVHGVLQALKEDGRQRMNILDSRHKEDLWNSLLQVMQPLTSQELEAQQQVSKSSFRDLLIKVKLISKDAQGRVQDRYPRDPQRITVLENLKKLLQRTDDRSPGLSGKAVREERVEALRHVKTTYSPALTNESEAISTIYQRAKYGAAWWSNNLFKAKTFVEARSVAAPFVAFWRVYNFHAVLFTAMMAGSLVLNQTGGIWTRTAPVDGWQLLAGLALSTVIDSLMRALRAAAYLLLFSYNKPVVRVQVALGEEDKPKRFKIDPFPSGSMLRSLHKAAKLVAWLIWSAFLALCVLPALVPDVTQPLARLPNITRLLHEEHWWLLPAVVHAVVFWVGSAFRQKSGYTVSWTGMMHEWFEAVNRKLPRRAGTGSAWAKLAGHADCATDANIDALFYPSRYLQVDRSRSWTNSALWVVVIMVKIAFEFFLIVQPLMLVILELLRVNDETIQAISRGPDADGQIAENIAKDAFASNRVMVDIVISSVVTWFEVVAVCVPAGLICLSDTGLLFNVAGGVVSGILGFGRGIGSMRTWAEMVPRFNTILDNYKQHCVSRSAVMLHLHGSQNLQNALQQLSMSALAAGWNALAYDLRQRDLLSNQELACITFEHLLADEEQEQELRGLGLLTVLPARCFIAGAISQLASAEGGSDHSLFVAGLCWQWFCWFLYKSGLIKRPDMEGLFHFQLPHPARSREQAQRRQEIFREAVRLIELLSYNNNSPSNLNGALACAAAPDVFDCAAAAADAASRTTYTGLLHAVPAEDRVQLKAYLDLRTSLELLLKCLRQEVKDMEAAPRSMPSSLDLSKVADALHRLEQQWAPWLQVEAAAGKLHSSRQGERAKLLRDRAFEESRARDIRKASMRDEPRDRWQLLQSLARIGRETPAVAQVAGWLVDALSLSLSDTIPSDEEAQKFIVSFAASLSDPNLKVAPALHVMPSMTTLTPHYAEDVMYALTEADAWDDIQDHNSSLSGDKGFRSTLPADPSRLANRGQVLCLFNDDETPTHTMAYLRSVYCRQHGAGSTQWDNFVERVKGLAAADGVDMNQLPARVNEFNFLPEEPLHKYKEELLLWASCRGQLLARTVRGMMTYRTALAALADFENPRHIPVTAAAAAAVRSSSSTGGAQPGNSISSNTCQPDDIRTAVLQDLVDRKFNYIVSSQNLGEFDSHVASDLKAAWLVRALRALMSRHPALKVAFIDKQCLVSASRPPGVKVDIRRDSSVLLCSTTQQQLSNTIGVHVAADEPQREAYRIHLPINFESDRGVIIGEGKPENQNHAIIFCQSEAVQTIDCNQDNLVAEGLKLRNLLAELLPDGWDHVQPAWRGFASRFKMSFTRTTRLNPADRRSAVPASNVDLLDEIPKGKGRVALVGFREWIFSEDSGALAEFAAATERSFGTTVQRVMHWPGAVRFHYGHPDVWRRSFVATCGGVSKANKGLHVSEDVFGGYNAMLRGRDIKYVDYIAVGKGRDMSMETICTFEAKVASGNGEQVLSREVRRLGHSMDFMRLMSWYHTGNGFFINTAITMLAVHATVWVVLLMSFLQEKNPVVQNWISAVQLLQLGTLSVVVYWITMVLDAGLFWSVWIIIRQVIQGSLMFYIIRAQTSAYSFTQDLLFGGAKYLATGRGYKLQPTPFKDLWCRFGRSHMYFGAVLTVYCLAILGAKSHNGNMSWSDFRAILLIIWAPILVILSLLFGPFWFTPLAFRTRMVQSDMDETQRWFLSPSLSHSWQAWNKEFTEVLSDAKGKQMGRFATAIKAHVMKLPTVLMLIAVTYRLDLRSGSSISKAVVMVVIAGGIILLISLIRTSRHWASRSAYKYQAPRLIQTGAYVLLIGGVISSGFATSGDVGELGNAPLVFFSLFVLLRLLPLFFYNPLLRRWFAGLTNGVYFAADAALAAWLECSLFVLSIFDIVTNLQVQLLFNTAYAKQVMSDTVLEDSKVPKLLRSALKLKRQQR